MRSKAPNVWKKVELGELCEKVGAGSTPTGGSKVYEEKGISFIRSQNILDFMFSIGGLVYINADAAEKLNNVEVLPNDILLNITGDSVARVCVVPNDILPARVNQHVSIIRTNEKLTYYRYILYKLQDLKPTLLSYASSGATRKALTKSMIENLEISLPSLKEQRAIADTLSSLDDKIKLNNKTNKNLEMQAQVIFKHWFVDFEFPDKNGNPYKSSGGKMVESDLGMIPQGWQAKRIEDFIKVVSKGTTPTKKDVDNAEDDNIISFIKVNNISNNGVIDYLSLDYIPRSIHITKLKRSILEYKDILLSIAGTIGRVSYIDCKLIDSNANQAIAFIRLKDIEKHFLFIFYYLRSNIFQNSINSKIVQGVQANISLTVIKNEPVVTPNDNILNLYNEIMGSVFKAININQKQNQKLAQLRDTLLPKLMSGEIRIPLD